MTTYTEYPKSASIPNATTMIGVGGLFFPKTQDCHHYVEMMDLIESGKAELVTYTPPSPTWDQIRAKREELLKATDWTQGSDCPLDITKKMQYRSYRQALRDLTTTFDSPSLVIWPEEPK